MRSLIRRLVLWAVPEASRVYEGKREVIVIGNSFSDISPRERARQFRERLDNGDN